MWSCTFHPPVSGVAVQHSRTETCGRYFFGDELHAKHWYYSPGPEERNVLMESVPLNEKEMILRGTSCFFWLSYPLTLTLTLTPPLSLSCCV